MKVFFLLFHPIKTVKYQCINIHIKAINQNQKRENLENQVKNPTELEADNDICNELLKLIIDENLQNDGKHKKIKDALKNNFKDYVFTKDNFKKMTLLFLRIRAGIPTILMGETGSGKTFMVRMFSLIYTQEEESTYILKFHSGTTDEDIEEFIRRTIKKVKEDEDKIINELKQNFDKDKKYYIESFRKSEEKEKEELGFFGSFFFTSKYMEKFKTYNKNVKKDIENKIKDRKIIIFFDEINTSNSLGTVKRIMCDYNFRKKLKISDRFIIIGACNPYRALNEENQNLQFGLTKRNTKQRKLVYTVNPLPYSLLNFILYFNDLPKETTLKYIQKMNEKINCSNENKQLINKLVSESHSFIISKGDISSVSLREINKFEKFFNFFHEKYLNIYRKKNLEEKKNLKKQWLLVFIYVII